ncbi:hypothetical protein HDA40_002158 [Hamadaea flava]|uniref:Uncharacterized protein n=1 Tax=Hamadaea flava TaxID=1742688 RepID=A0ABV8LLP1_9ACTN|nr:hypothetical protein [Hamadaea flava]MCP2323651.1 hypothetical protein [Hamadaea flava]
MFSLFGIDSVSVKVLVCLPAADHSRSQLRHQLIAALAPYTVRACLAHQWLFTGNAAEFDPFAGKADTAGPLGLLGTTTAGGAAADAAISQYDAWLTAIYGTEEAAPLRAYVDPNHGGDAAERIDRFHAQPRIRAMRVAEHNGDAQFPRADYGPGLTALQAGVAVYVPYTIDSALFGDALVTVDGQLLAPTGADEPLGLPILPRVWHTYAERIAYHQAARAALHNAGSTAIVTAVEARFRSRPVHRHTITIEHPFLGQTSLLAVSVPEASDPTDLIVCPPVTANRLRQHTRTGTILGHVRVAGTRVETAAYQNPADNRRGQRTNLNIHDSREQALVALLDYYLDLR